MEYVTVKTGFLTCYSDAFIADETELYFISLFGRQAIVKAISASIAAGRYVSVDGKDYWMTGTKKILTHTADGLMHRIVYVPHMFQQCGLRILPYDKKPVFSFVDSSVSTPLKEEWTEWLWEEVVKKEKLTAFGFDREIYLARISSSIDSEVIEALKKGRIR